MSVRTVVHSSGRFDRPVALLAKDVRSFRKFAEISSYTELSGRSKAEVKEVFGSDDGRKYFWDPRDKGQNECLTEWDSQLLELAGTPSAELITDMTFTRSEEYGGKESKPFYVTVVPLQRKTGVAATAVNTVLRRRKVIVVITGHMPLDNTELRAKIWVDAMKGLREVVRKARRDYPGCKIMINADWNKNCRDHNEHARVVRYVSNPLDLKICWDGRLPKNGGTHHNALIDATLTDLRIVDARLLEDTKSSDHRPYAVDVRF